MCISSMGDSFVDVVEARDEREHAGRAPQPRRLRGVGGARPRRQDLRRALRRRQEGAHERRQLTL